MALWDVLWPGYHGASFISEETDSESTGPESPFADLIPYSRLFAQEKSF